MISIIVPCRDAGSHFRPMLQSLVDQEVAEPAEIVVVDNGSRDGSADVARATSGRIPLRVVHATERANASYARNVGVREARGDKLLFADADDALAPGYVDAMTRALDAHAFVTSRVDTESLNAPWLRLAHGEPWQAEDTCVFFGFMTGTGVNIGVRRELFERIGGFPEAFRGSQDIVFAWRAQLAGSPLVFVRDAVYRYRFRDTVGGLFRQTRNWGTSNVLLYRHFREAGMRRRPVSEALAEWCRALGGVVRRRSRADVAAATVSLGYCVGRLWGSIRYRTFYP